MTTQNDECSSFSITSPSDDGETSVNHEVVVLDSSDSDSMNSPPNPVPTFSPTQSITSHISSDNPPLSPGWRSDPNVVDDKCFLRSYWCSIESLNNNRLSAKGFTKVNPNTGVNDDLSLNVAPCDDEDIITKKPSGADGSPAWFYIHGFIFTELYMKLPFSPFVCDVLTFLNVAPCQLLPNAWGFIRCFELLCEQLSARPLILCFFTFIRLILPSHLLSRSFLYLLAIIWPSPDLLRAISNIGRRNFSKLLTLLTSKTCSAIQKIALFFLCTGHSILVVTLLLTWRR